MILDKENYESRGPVKGLFYLIWTMLTSGRFKGAMTLAQTQRKTPALGLNAEGKIICRSCKKCEQICPTQAIRVRGNESQAPSEFELDLLKCTSCLECVSVCPTEALVKSTQAPAALHVEGAYALNKEELIQLGQSNE